ncbi:hypothetical protein PIB30_074291 [Stylosanthes scabra]|uniref:Uncharacterized protein n=1 Tax=Stylosanthes scabra TaxID=79078 RepID=A0ABU6TRV2_9FABA|nr:hypothetical protein [Stylosanthes scabra]
MLSRAFGSFSFDQTRQLSIRSEQSATNLATERAAAESLVSVLSLQAADATWTVRFVAQINGPRSPTHNAAPTRTQPGFSPHLQNRSRSAFDPHANRFCDALTAL